MDMISLYQIFIFLVNSNFMKTSSLDCEGGFGRRHAVRVTIEILHPTAGLWKHDQGTTTHRVAPMTAATTAKLGGGWW
jgi:hypothetical protein